MKEVWVLTISYDSGVNISAHKNIKTAEAILENYVRDNWSNKKDIDSMPIKEAIDIHFEGLFMSEWYTLDLINITL